MRLIQSSVRDGDHQASRRETRGAENPRTHPEAEKRSVGLRDPAGVRGIARSRKRTRPIRALAKVRHRSRVAGEDLNKRGEPGSVPF